jgi:hypothetical protein
MTTKKKRKEKSKEEKDKNINKLKEWRQYCQILVVSQKEVK